MENLKLILADVEETYSENDVTALCHGIIELSGKTLLNGYKIVTQANYLRYVPDIVIRILKNNKPHIVIECKGGNGNAPKHYDKSMSQIKDYMINLEFPFGFLVFPNKTIFLIKNDNISIKTEWSNSADEMADIVSVFRDL